MLSTMAGSYYIGKDKKAKGKFLPGLKNIGKYTRKTTTTIAKAFLPPSLVDAAASFDPTRKKASPAGKSAGELLQPSASPASPAIKKPLKAKVPIPIVPLVVGSLAIAALVVIGKKGRK